MPSNDTTDFSEALQRCNDEPIHIPGLIQTCGHILAVDRTSLLIRYASSAAGAIFGFDTRALLGQSLQDYANEAIIHAIRNSAAKSGQQSERQAVGALEFEGASYHLSVSSSGDCWVFEFEPTSLHGVTRPDHFRDFPLLMNQVQTASSVGDLMDRLVHLFSALSEYDRVMVYRFDADWNGEVIAEQCSADVASYLGLRFPHWDIPAQARAMMTKFLIRYIYDARAGQHQLLAASEEDQPLDITFAQLRGVSPIHLQYLHNMDVRGTMTLTISVEDRLWGIFSFHNKEPKVPSVDLRHICASLAPIINTKLHALEQQQTLHIHKLIGDLQSHTQAKCKSATAFEEELDAIAQLICREFDVDGVTLGVEDQEFSSGTSLSGAVLDTLRSKARSSDGNIWHTQNLVSHFPDLAGDLAEVSGALCVDANDGRWVCLTRRARLDDVLWAGAPAKEVDQSTGISRLEPRGSFTLYKETVKDTSTPWLEQDMTLLRGISLSMLATNQRKAVLEAIRRQQDLVVDELNHRVRNILALVRSISGQALKHNSSLESYAAALEQRMKALAIAHDLGAGNSASTPVSLQQILKLEAEPYIDGIGSRFAVSGEDAGLTPEAAPIFALVIHELMTNAAKYGALSASEGQVLVSTRLVEAELVLNWIEVGGPVVVPPDQYGFGTTLIEQAVPYELLGQSELNFNPSGLVATIKLPTTILAQIPADDPLVPTQAITSSTPTKPRTSREGTVLVVEDNYMIAIDMLSNLRSLGIQDAELAATSFQATRLLNHHDVVLAILDINLGRGGTSIELARHLEAKGIPYFFVTGYGELAPLPTGLTKKLKLTKPVSQRDLDDAIETVLGSASEAAG